MLLIKIIKWFAKLLNIILVLSFIFITLIIIFVVNSKDYSIKHERKNLRNIIKSGTVRNNLLNDYNEVFIPETQFQKFNYKKIKLDFLTPKESTFFYSRHYTFFIEEKNEEIFFITQKGNLFFAKKNELNSDKIDFKKIPTNLTDQRILDMKIFR